MQPLLQRQNGDNQEQEEERWNQDEPSSDDSKQRVWITDGKSNVKYAITQLNYSQVNISIKSRFILKYDIFLGSCYVNTVGIVRQFEQRRKNDDYYKYNRSRR